MLTRAHPLSGSPYGAYSYSYPHKFAYRPFQPKLPLADVWRHEDRESLFLYVHIPFCEHRCGFCNLFTLARPEQGLTTRYLKQLQAQMGEVRSSVDDFQTARLAIGGGTPTFLDIDELQALFSMFSEELDVDARTIPACMEASPATLSAEKAALLAEFGIDRVSLGIQSFDEQDAHRMGRPQRQGDIERALQAIREARFPTLNLDLIYGGDGQTVETWLATIRTALAYRPEEIYLYPLYVRPATGLGKLERSWDDHRLELYRAGRDLLLETGYEQASLRMFRAPHAPDNDGPKYCCQEDGMIGLGCGARSYTTHVHYSSEYATGRAGVRSILADYLATPIKQFRMADYGFQLDAEEQRRRFLILSLLQANGLSRDMYQSRFGTEVLRDFPELRELEQHALATISENTLQLTASGLERSDAIGPWLYSSRVQRLIEEYECR